MSTQQVLYLFFDVIEEVLYIYTPNTIVDTKTFQTNQRNQPK